MKEIASLLTLFIVAPIWYYLLYQILVRIDASELMFFLFWVYVPSALVGAAMARLAGVEK